MDWLKITVKTTTLGADIISEILSEFSAGGVIIEDKADILSYDRPKEQWDYVDEKLADAFEDEVCVRGFVDFSQGIEALKKVTELVAQAKDNNPDFDWGSLTIQSEGVKDENWSENWKKYYKPFKPGKKIVIKPSWEEYQKNEGDVVLEIDPGAAFGTGSHETTKMCICMLEDYVTSGTSVMDVGCGTGILAMCAYLLGAKSVFAVDIDQGAVDVAKKNVALSGFNITVEQGNLLENRYETVDLIVANIIADAVMLLAAKAREHLKEGGIYITSGIINERADEVEAHISALGFKKIEKRVDGEWSAFAWRK